MEIGLFVLGIAAGVMSGLFGIGGGIVMVPMLIALFGMDLLNANATSLAAMLLPVGVMGVISFYKAGLIRVKDSLWISLGLFAGSFGGGELAVHLNVALLAKLYAAVLIYVAVTYIIGSRKQPTAATQSAEKAYPFYQFILVGAVAGVFAGLFGKGGGLVIVPALTKLFRYEPKAATATSLAALQLPVGLPSVLVYAQQGYLNVGHAALVAVGILAGAYFGSKAALRLSGDIFKRIYALFLFCVAVYMFIKYI